MSAEESRFCNPPTRQHCLACFYGALDKVRGVLCRHPDRPDPVVVRWYGHDCKQFTPLKESP